MGPPDDRLSAAQRSRIRRLGAPQRAGEGEEAAELNVVPFLDIITNVMMFVLATIAITLTVSVEAKAPSARRHGIPDERRDLDLVVLVLKDGYYVKTRDASVAYGCETTCSGNCGPTVPRVAASTDESTDGAKYDAAGLTACARKLEDAIAAESPDLARETQVMVSANPDVPFQEIVRAMDALRRDARGDLFPDVVLTVWK